MPVGAESRPTPCLMATHAGGPSATSGNTIKPSSSTCWAMYSLDPWVWSVDVTEPHHESCLCFWHLIKKKKIIVNSGVLNLLPYVFFCRCCIRMGLPWSKDSPGGGGFEGEASETARHFPVCVSLEKLGHLHPTNIVGRPSSNMRRWPRCSSKSSGSTHSYSNPPRGQGRWSALRSSWVLGDLAGHLAGLGHASTLGPHLGVTVRDDCLLVNCCCLWVELFSLYDTPATPASAPRVTLVQCDSGSTNQSPVFPSHSDWLQELDDQKPYP
ncbi:uncharacterized protein LOC144251079 [Urocitellus parryii]